MANCPICQKSQPGSALLDRLPPCTSCGFDRNRPESTIDAVIQRCRLGAARIFATNGTAVAVLKDPTTGQPLDDKTYKRVEPPLRRIHCLHEIAGFIRNLVDYARDEDKRRRYLKLIDDALKKGDAVAWLEPATHADWARNTNGVQQYCLRGWDALERKWPTLSPDEKDHFRGLVFEHEKGYPQTAATAENYQKPSDKSASLVAASLLAGPTENSVLTGERGKGFRSVGSFLEEGKYRNAKTEEKDYFWYWLLGQLCREFVVGRKYLLGHEYDLAALGTVIAAIKRDRAAFDTAVGTYDVPAADISAVVDGGKAQELWKNPPNPKGAQQVVLPSKTVGGWDNFLHTDGWSQQGFEVTAEQIKKVAPTKGKGDEMLKEALKAAGLYTLKNKNGKIYEFAKAMRGGGPEAFALQYRPV